MPEATPMVGPIRSRVQCVMRYATFVILLSSASSVFALGEPSYVDQKGSKASLSLVAKNGAAPLYVDADDHKGVVRALGDLKHDIDRVSGQSPAIVNALDTLRGHAVIVGTIGKSKLIDELIEKSKIDPSAIAGQWDAYHIEVVENPLPNVERALVIAGADMRGTIYGIYDVSEQIGVSPWHYWADVPADKMAQIHIRGATKVQDAPVVKYRGIFLNDEAPALTNWVNATHGEYNHEFYVKIFELLLRMKANFLWPVMWNNAFADDDPMNMVLADEYGIVMGTSHHEPMMRADKEWNRYGTGPWEYSTNPENLYSFWQQGAERNKPYESIFTLGMRGQEDAPMSEGENIELLEEVVADQREILTKVFADSDVTDVPQVWALYKEVQAYYEKGMRVPDDVTLLWSDDNWGNIRRLPTPAERDRKGGAGVYYHFDYVGGPRSYRWINTVPVAKIWEQMNLAHQYGADRLWITNVGDLKPMEFPTEFFLRMAWNPEKWSKDRIREFGQLWAEREFGKAYAEEIESLITGYTKHNGRRKPELMEPDTYSLVHYEEADRVLADVTELVERAEALYKKIPAEKKDAYYQLVLHPVKATATITQLNIATGRNRLYAKQGRATADVYREQAKAFFQLDADLKKRYHSINDGKWRHFMDQSHIGYTNWQNPEGDQLPVLYEYVPGDYAEMGIAVEGIEAGWPASVSGEWPHVASHELTFDANGKGERWFTMYNRGTVPYEFTAKPSAPWIKLSTQKSEVEKELKVSVTIDWSKLPAGDSQGSIEIRGTGWQPANIGIHAFRPEPKLQRQAKGFLEADGYIAIEAASYSRSRPVEGYEWQEIETHGRTRSSVSTFPVTDKSFEKPSAAPYLEYDVTFFSTGEFQIDTLLAPSWPIVPGRGLRYAISIGDEDPQVVDFLEHFDGTDGRWEETVETGIAVGKSKHEVTKKGPTKLRIYMIDPAVTVQKIIVDTGGLQPSYLGPPESPRIH